MKGAKLSKPALTALSEIRKARSFTDFSEKELLNKKTLLKMARGAYVAAEIVSKAEAALIRWLEETMSRPQLIMQRTAEKMEVSVQQLLTEKQKDKLGNYSPGALARYAAVYLTYKETRLSYRKIAAEFGYKDHTSVINNIQIISDLMDTRPELRRKILEIQKSL